MISKYFEIIDFYFEHKVQKIFFAGQKSVFFKDLAHLEHQNSWNEDLTLTLFHEFFMILGKFWVNTVLPING